MLYEKNELQWENTETEKLQTFSFYWEWRLHQVSAALTSSRLSGFLSDVWALCNQQQHVNNTIFYNSHEVALNNVALVELQKQTDYSKVSQSVCLYSVNAPLTAFFPSCDMWCTVWSASSGVLDGEAAVHLAAVLRLQAVGDAELHLLAAPQEAASVPGQLLPGAPPVLLLLATAGEELLHVVTETHLDRKKQER